MTDIEPDEDLPPVAHVTIVYTGPVAPHWELKVRYGDQKMLDEFWTRVNARLLLLPKHDPQFRRNRERVNRDAERELIVCDWDLGENDAESTVTEVTPPPGAVVDGVPTEPAADEAEEAAVDAEAEETPADAVELETEEPEAEGEGDMEAEEPAEEAADEDSAEDAGEVPAGQP